MPGRVEGRVAVVSGAGQGIGRIDILVNVVGGNRTARIWEMSEETWDGVLR